MKIQFTESRELQDGTIVNTGTTLESPRDGSDELLQAYVQNGVADVVDDEKTGKRISEEAETL